MKCKFGFVILHYLALNDTYECINSIESLYKDEDFYIVIVDNKSPDNSGSELDKQYKDNPRVKIIHTEENLGFSRGNNIGYTYLRENLSPEFILILNNDVEFIDKNFLKTVSDLYEERKYEVLGPDVKNLDGDSISPIFNHPFSYEELKTLRRNLIYEPLFKKIGDSKLFNIAMNLFHKIKEVEEIKENLDNFDKESDNCIVEGSCLIFSREYIDKHEYAFYPMDSFYFEESILKRMVDKDGGLLLYSPKLSILHKESRATSTIVEDKKRREFIRKNQIKSIKTFMRIY